jgi:NADH dehydrogenase
VRWRLFRQEDLPARLRRLQRLEEVAESERRRNGAAPETRPDGR